MNNMLSQEEIDAMMNETGGGEEARGAEALKPHEIDTLGEVGNICMGVSATTLYTLLNRRVEITTPRVSIVKPSEILEQYDIPFAAVDVHYTEGIEGRNLLLLKEADVLLITDLLMGGEGVITPDAELDEMHLSAISEVMNQMMGAAATSLSEMLNVATNISPPNALRVGDESKNIDEVMGDNLPVVQICFVIEIEGLLNSELMQIMPYDFAKKLVGMLLKMQAQEAAAGVSSVPVAAASHTSGSGAPKSVQQPKQVDVKSIQYQSFDTPSVSPINAAQDKLSLISDVSMQVTVELGKSRKSIQEILGFGMGTIIVLEKAAGEPVEVLVNGKLIARGEVVVIDENYGVRITDIVFPSTAIMKYN